MSEVAAEPGSALARARVPILVAVLLGLTLHTFLLMVLYGLVGVPGRYLTVLSAWKEALVALAAAGLVLWTLFTAARRRFGWDATDLLVAAVVVLVLAMGAYTVATPHILPLTAILYGMRFYLVPVAAYVVGRLLPLGRADLGKVMWATVLIGGATGLLALGERLLTDQAYVQLVESLGYKSYFGFVHEVLSGPGPTAASTWADAGHGIGRRAGSIYLVSKPFALALLVSIPLSVAMLWRATGRARVLLWLSSGLVALGLALTYTRAAIAVGVLAAVVVALLVRRWQVLPAFAVGLLAGLALFSLESGYLNPPGGLRPEKGLTSSDLTRISLNGSSDEEHLGAWKAAFQSGLHRPILGWGPGAGNEDSQRFLVPAANSPITEGAESVFLQVFEELGALGLLLYSAVFLAIIVAAWRVYRRGPPGSPEWLLAATMIGMTLAVGAIGTTTPIWSGAFVLTYAYWWLAGLTVQARANGSLEALVTVPTEVAAKAA